MTPTKRVLFIVGTTCASAVLLTGCSKTVSKADVEKQSATQLAAVTNQPVPKVTCPGDLEAKVGATMKCTLVAKGDTVKYPVTITVTSLKGGKANFNAVVGPAK
ncbi:MAG: DUF4333 domain-containing protein [Aeromicrobium sp.]